ncbi:MAG: ribosome biogenesis GTPase Der, partial [Planctomycetota bacterium]|nr:ribosome biogenesis GTPase Der [Planctomycetota bacterium]
PVVAIVGRPNVGKSALFNRIARRRIAIVEPTYGVTRDRITAAIEVGDRNVELIDTGGIAPDADDGIGRQIQDQIRLALRQADVVLFIVDVRDGPTPRDHEVANLLREFEKPILLVANKVETPALEVAVTDFYELGLGEPIAVSAIEGYGTQTLIETATDLLPESTQSPSGPLMSFAIVGRRNVGKSTYVNALAREERMIVSEVPGTTRDSVDIRFERGGKTYVAIDTAGLRKKGKMDDAIEFFSRVRTEESIRRADLVLILIDGSQGITRIDKKIADQVVASPRPCVVVVNKWDLAPPEWTTERIAGQVRKRMPGIAFAPVVFVSAKTGKDILAPLRVAEELHRQAGLRASTSEVNRVIRAAMEQKATKVRAGVQGKVYYAAQVGTRPPHVLLFVNHARLFTADYRRFLQNRLRDDLPFHEIPIRVTIRQRVSAFAK